MKALARRAVCAAALPLALGVTACGEALYAGTPESQEQARAAVETWLGACANEDSEPVTEILTSPEREIIFKAPSVLAGCAEIARVGPPPGAPVEELEKAFEAITIDRVQVEGGIGIASIRGPSGATAELQVEVDRGRWMLSNPPLVAP